MQKGTLSVIVQQHFQISVLQHCRTPIFEGATNSKQTKYTNNNNEKTILRIQSHSPSKTCHIKGKTKYSTELEKFNHCCVKKSCVSKERLQRSGEQLCCSCYCLCKSCTQRNKKQSNCCCLQKVLNSGTQNYAINKEFELKLNTKLFLFYLQSTCSYFKRNNMFERLPHPSKHLVTKLI